jgi:hypothetical protein
VFANFDYLFESSYISPTDFLNSNKAILTKLFALPMVFVLPMGGCSGCPQLALWVSEEQCGVHISDAASAREVDAMVILADL